MLFYDRDKEMEQNRTPDIFISQPQLTEMRPCNTPDHRQLDG
jgi:hypothetical protein